MPTLTNEEILFAFQRLQMIGQQGLPIKVSYAATQTKKNLEPYAETFQEKTEDVEEGTDEFEEHLSQEFDVEVHEVAPVHLDGSGLAPELFVGIGFLFREDEERQEETFEITNGELLQATNTLYRWARLEFDSGGAIVSLAGAIDSLRGSDAGKMQERLGEFNQRIESAQEQQEGSDQEGPEQEVSKIEEEREKYLEETTEVTVSLIDLEAIASNEDVEVAPLEIEILSPLLK
ncbi:hypothetical protein [Salinibacter ruber]|uniref:Uncharacterized protein n=1 Tax=Salinibacter ruber TaxID=146919 RepID=A0A9X2QE81_9BACT|nr:hypothetical protein [Salinibacter ruber]MCS3661807.1 hypothetical protein [Salinibacter ruber]MCS3711532.1 hypothetical protein [Salinibacter ruber]